MSDAACGRLMRILSDGDTSRNNWLIRICPTLFIAACLCLCPSLLSANPGLTGRPDRVLLIIGDQWDDPSSFLIRTDNELHEIASLHKSWGTPFDILRLDQQQLGRNCFLDYAGNPRYGAILWNADPVAFESQKYSVLPAGNLRRSGMTSNHFAIFLKLTLIISFAGFAAGARACDTWVALQDATADHSVILAKNSDRPPMEAQPLVQVPHQKHTAGEMVKCTYIEVPQVPETYEHIGSKIWWSFGYEHGMNEYGVAIGNEGEQSKEPMQSAAGLLGMDLVRLGLERGKTAYEAMHVMIDLLERYGQGGECEHEGEWGKSTYHNSFILADSQEAWVLETAGKYWVAKRIRNGVYSIANIYSIERDWDEAHPRLVQHAVEMGWTKSAQGFNFARDYGNYWGKDSANPGTAQIRRNMTLVCLRKDFAQVTPASMMQISRSHLEGTIAEPRWGAAETFWVTPCMHDSAHVGYHTAASLVAQLRAEMPPLVRQVYWASFSNPCCNVYMPFYLHGPRLPLSYAVGTSTYSGDSPWWWANRVKLLCDLNYSALAPTVRGVFDRTERWEMERQTTTEAEALRKIKAGKETDAVELLQQFINDNCERVEKEYWMLNEVLSAALKTVGSEYVFADYMKNWTSRKGVPLPLL